MSQNKQEFEARGQNVEQAVRSGLERLGLDRDEVIVEVIDEGSRGLLGIGSRDAVVLLKPLTIPTVKLSEQAPPVKSKPVQTPPVAAPKVVQTTPEPEAIVDPVAQKKRKTDTEQTATSASDLGRRSSVQAISPEDATEIEAEKEIAVDTIKTLLSKMNVEATITSKLSSPDDLTGKRINIIEINGEDLGVLIGPRGETLNSIQYISRLMVAHKLHRRVDFVVDVSQYRQRREQALTRMAERMANKVIKRNAPVGLEPMPPNERRIIHMALRENEAVYTQSVGEGNRRKIRILPKQQ